MTNRKKHITRRSFLTTAGIATAAAALYPKNALFAKAIEALPPAPGATSLAGNWRFLLGRADAGASAGWFAKPLARNTSIA